MRKLNWVLLPLLLFSAGCDDGGDEQGEEDLSYEVRRDEAEEGPAWQSWVVAQGDVGLHLEMAQSPTNGEVGIAYFAMTGVEDGLCDEIGDDPPLRVLWSLYFAYSQDGESWTTEEVDQLLFLAEPPGLDLVYGSDGVPIIAVMNGEPNVQIRYCGSNDLAVYRRDGGWSSTVAVAESGEAVTGEPASDYGTVVGYWPAIAYNDSGDYAIAYKDVHSGIMQSDDYRRADLELARNSGGWSHEAIDIGEGAGSYNAATYLGDRLVVSYLTPTEDADLITKLGIWVALESEEGWLKAQVFNKRTPSGPSVLAERDGGVMVAYYNSDLGYPVLAQISGEDLGDFL